MTFLESTRRNTLREFDNQRNYS